MAQPINLLQLSPTMSEGTLVKWLVKEGDDVKSAQPIAEVETDKAVMEQESFEDGKVLKLVAKEGDKIPVEGLIAIIGEEGEDFSDLLEDGGSGGKKAASKKDSKGGAKKDKKGKKSAKASKEEVPDSTQPEPDEEKEAAAAAAREKKKKEAKAEPEDQDGRRVFASPLARKMAREAGIELADIEGSGPKGRVIKADVEAAIEEGPRRKAPTGAPEEEVEEIALSGIRQTIARRLTESKQQIPHFQLNMDVRGERLLEGVARIRDQYPDTKVTVSHFLIKAMANVQMRHQAIRSQWAGESLKVINAAHISVAVAIEAGLVTPVLRNAHLKGVLQIAEELRELVKLAKARKLQTEDMTGGTQTLSNLGMYGITDFTAIINPPESTILAVGAMEDRPVVENGQIVAGKVMTLSMSCDHRVVDGAVGAQYLADLKRALEDPMFMLL